jgi:catechol 2,3-dioxygenase-like lactoylglutathione lyase family enzyme
MTDLKRFLNILTKVGYPNSDIKSIAKAVGYNLEEFLPDLVSEIGQEKADEFTEKAIKKISTPNGIKIKDMDDPEQYAYIKLHNPRLDLDNDETTVLCDWQWGDTHIYFRDDDGNESYKTISEIADEVGMGDWSDFDEMVDDIRESCNRLVFSNCGFGIWWDDQKDIVNNV